MRRWEDKRVVILGVARQGKALARYLTEQGAAVVLSDIKTAGQLHNEIGELADLELNFELGGHPLELLDEASALFLSGGVPADLPIARAALERGIPLLNDAQIFLERCPGLVIGITGSAGKTTTTTLVDQILRTAFQGTGRTVWLGGNIGRPLLLDLDGMQPQDVAVMELSSFQLELMSVSPGIAAILNLTPDHLDRHGSMQAYVEAKKRILTFQTEADIAVLGYEDPETWALRDIARGQVIAFGINAPTTGDAAYLEGQNLILRVAGQAQVICELQELALRGRHNLLNFLAACALSSTVQASVEVMAQVARTFEGVPHRLEFVREVLGAGWYNDSIATTPDRAIAAVRSFEEPLILLLGGREKDLPWESFADEVSKRAKAIVLFGEAVPKLEAIFKPKLEKEDGAQLHIAPDLAGAIDIAAKVVDAGDIVLLSPGCTSYDEFPNFEVRGERFREWVKTL